MAPGAKRTDGATFRPPPRLKIASMQDAYDLGLFGGAIQERQKLRNPLSAGATSNHFSVTWMYSVVEMLECRKPLFVFKNSHRNCFETSTRMLTGRASLRLNVTAAESASGSYKAPLERRATCTRQTAQQRCRLRCLDFRNSHSSMKGTQQ